MGATLDFGDGRISTFSNSFESSFRQCATFVGTKQSIELTDFVISGTESTECAYTHYKNHGLSKYDVVVQKEVEEVKVPMARSQEASMWECFAKLHNEKDGDGKQNLAFWADVALNTQKVLDAIMASI